MPVTIVVAGTKTLFVPNLFDLLDCHLCQFRLDDLI